MKNILILVVFVLAPLNVAFAAHPLITDDTGTMGKGASQLELNGEASFDKETVEGETTRETVSELAVAMSYGVSENVDIVAGVPYQWIRQEEGDEETNEDGIADISLELKWRFYERDGLSLAIKPGMTIPTGDEEKGLGNGKSSYGITLITTKSAGPWEFELNVGYWRNEYGQEEEADANRKDIWNISLATTREITERLKAVADIGMERNAEMDSDTPPAFILGGLIYSVSEKLDIDVGVKAGLNKPEADGTVLAGMAFAF